MSCYNPQFLRKTGQINLETGKPVYLFVPPLEVDDDMRVNTEAYGLVKIPCGKCTGCRLDYSRHWADRMMLELETAKKGLFVTLTYDDDSVPKAFDDFGNLIGYTLDKKDAQDFMKNFRRHCDKKVRFFCCGEYGGLYRRPHLHFILFGIGLDDFPPDHLKPLKTNDKGDVFYDISDIDAAWSNFEGRGRARHAVSQKGFTYCSNVSWFTCAYVARYVLKKAGLSRMEESYQEPEFVLMSRRPGIGADYLAKNPDCLRCTNIPVLVGDKVRKLPIPQYYFRKFDLTDPEECAKIKDVRKCAAIDSELLRMSSSTLKYLDQLELDARTQARRISGLKRDL